jgi:hypothetical protein
MSWEVVTSEQFNAWFGSLTEAERRSVIRNIELLRQFGPQLPDRYSRRIIQSRHSHMRELRIQHAGNPYRALYAFDPRRTAVLLVGGDKTGDDRWYEKNVPVADRLYDEWLKKLGEEKS